MRKKILLCDDNDAIVEVTTLILTREGYDVDNIRSSDDIARKTRECMPHLILMDLRVPRMGGEKATRVLKEDPKTNHIPVIIFSANTDGAAIATRIGADGFISKPYDISELIQLIESKTSSKV